MFNINIEIKFTKRKKITSQSIDIIDLTQDFLTVVLEVVGKEKHKM